jgi:hypothetical protein
MGCRVQQEGSIIAPVDEADYLMSGRTVNLAQVLPSTFT